jgi:hypothetical protein
MNTLAYFKILVSFATIASTLGDQFDIPWPWFLGEAFETLGVLCMDIRRFSRLFCLVDMSFFDSLLASILSLLAILLLIFAHYKSTICQCKDKTQYTRLKSRYAAMAVYLLIFVYPLLAKNLVKAFGCHRVYGVTYLREDYSIVCTADGETSNQWRKNAVSINIIRKQSLSSDQLSVQGAEVAPPSKVC